MKKVIKTIVFILLFQINSLSYAVDYKYKSVKYFKVLSSFKSIKEFEDNYGVYIQHCLDNTFGGTGGIPCYIGYNMWDRELNIYYKKLYSSLSKKAKSILKKSQKFWLKKRDLSIESNSRLLDKKYTEPGTIYLLIRAGDADSAITPIIKQRALFLKKQFESAVTNNK